jgi:hypothetical protein
MRDVRKTEWSCSAMTNDEFQDITLEVHNQQRTAASASLQPRSLQKPPKATGRPRRPGLWNRDQMIPSFSVSLPESQRPWHNLCPRQCRRGTRKSGNLLTKIHRRGMTYIETRNRDARAPGAGSRFGAAVFSLTHKLQSLRQVSLIQVHSTHSSAKHAESGVRNSCAQWGRTKGNRRVLPTGTFTAFRC